MFILAFNRYEILGRVKYQRRIIIITCFVRRLRNCSKFRQTIDTYFKGTLSEPFGSYVDRFHKLKVQKTDNGTIAISLNLL